ncbi:helix-turn-helix domain-containing protein [Chitinimonas prasina]|nr:helix-turn-helix domain-containing protein [Chitinimonas prasina]
MVVARRPWLTKDLLSLEAGKVVITGLYHLMWSSTHANSAKKRLDKAATYDPRQVCHLPHRLGSSDFSTEVEVLGRALLSLPESRRNLGMSAKQFLSQHERNDVHGSCFVPLPGMAPPDLAKSAYAYLFDKAAPAAPVDGDTVAALAWLGLSFLGLARMTLCRFCPRWAFPGTGVCPAHSQAVVTDGTASEKAARFRFARQVGEHYNYYQRDIPKFVPISNENVCAYISRLLWSTVLPDEERTARAIKAQIRRSVLLQDWVGGDFSNLKSQHLYIRLRQTIDPFEYRPRVWRWKLQRLRLWLTYADMVQCQPRKKSRRTRDRIRTASELESLGYTQSEIAKELGITPAAVSLWLKRSGHSTFEALLRSVNEEQLQYTLRSVQAFEAKLLAGYRPNFSGVRR